MTRELAPETLRYACGRPGPTLRIRERRAARREVENDAHLRIQVQQVRIHLRSADPRFRSSRVPRLQIRRGRTPYERPRRRARAGGYPLRFRLRRPACPLLRLRRTLPLPLIDAERFGRPDVGNVVAPRKIKGASLKKRRALVCFSRSAGPTINTRRSPPSHNNRSRPPRSSRRAYRRGRGGRRARRRVTGRRGV